MKRHRGFPGLFVATVSSVGAGEAMSEQLTDIGSAESPGAVEVLNRKTKVLFDCTSYLLPKSDLEALLSTLSFANDQIRLVASEHERSVIACPHWLLW